MLLSLNLMLVNLVSTLFDLKDYFTHCIMIVLTASTPGFYLTLTM